MKHGIHVPAISPYTSPRGWLLLGLMVAAMFLGFNGLVMADTTGTLSTVTDATDSLYDTLNAILRPVSLIAIIILGIMAGTGRMEWGTVFKVFIGLVIANSAVTILDWMSAGTTAT
jgi:type IV secretory pathway VirB2 component (pilin)